jgi:hypothetical protein
VLIEGDRRRQQLKKRRAQRRGTPARIARSSWGAVLFSNGHPQKCWPNSAAHVKRVEEAIVVLNESLADSVVGAVPRALLGDHD